MSTPLHRKKYILEYFSKLEKSNTTTLFEMGRCTDDTCKEIDNNAILDVSPNSKEDPLTWFKVSQLPYIG